MTYLLDTNACIAVINGRPESVRERLAEVAARGDAVATSTVVVFELWYGVSKSTRVESNEVRLSAFLAGPVGVLDFEEEDAHVAGAIRAELERAGTPIGAYDVLIAAQGVRHQATVVTANHPEFGRVAGLTWEDWAVG